MAEVTIVAIGDEKRSGKKNVAKGMKVSALIKEMGFDPARMKPDSVSIDGAIIKNINQIIPEGAKGVLIAKNAENGKHKSIH